MAVDVIMPALGAAMKSGKLIRWYKRAGETVAPGDALMEVETDKVTLDIEATAAGVLASVTARAGDDVPVGSVVAQIIAPGELVPTPVVGGTAPTSVVGDAAPTPQAPLRRPLISPVATKVAAEFGVDLAAVQPTGGRILKEDVLAYVEGRGGVNGRVKASPKARRLASERGLDLRQMAGSGPFGAVLAADVLRAADSLPPPPVLTQRAPEPPTRPTPAAPELPMSGTWQMMARRTTESWQQAPHFFLTRDVDAGNLQAWRRQARQRIDGLTVSDLLVLLIARTLRDHPRVNAAWVNERIVLNEQINIGLAVAVEDGLLVPVIYQADRLGLRELMARRAAVAEMAAKGRLTLADVRDATFTVSNLGMFGVDSFQAILNPPQAAILAVGRIADRIVPVDGLPAVRPMMTLTLSCDHRVLDGARAARFLEQLVRLIEDPLASLD